MTAQEYYLDLPLYSPINIDTNDQLKALIYSIKVADFVGYNPVDKIETTFMLEYNTLYDQIFQKQTMYLECVLTCRRSGQKFYFFSLWDGTSKRITKIGQNPSLADFHISQVKQYDKLLKKQDLREFTKAIGLAANGVGIGSFVYLRRIFEHLIDESVDQMKTVGGFDEEDFNRMRMAERIDYLKDYLPEFLVAHKEIYGILSVGIHELTEEVCLSHFDVVKTGIEFILDEKLEKATKAKKMAEASAKIRSTAIAIKKT
jgi:hypothetical protein